MALVMILALGLVQTALVLYARNVVISAAHEGVRAGVELGASAPDAAAIAGATVERSAGGVTRDLDVGVSMTGSDERAILHVEVSGTLRAFGPIPVGVPVHASAAAPLEKSNL